MTVSIGGRLKQARQEAQMTQEEVASEFKHTRQTISSWEHDRTTPSLSEFRELATLYGVSADYLLYGAKVREVRDSLMSRLCGTVSTSEDAADSTLS
ncbi:MAG TPA: helix-turn-helix transcriptional regulator [Ramlibacter sp.]|uniref:helix-turn-helix transcriptional regulator n=1 Tax=Ramlibacter sp. TaxID=1917967 RepID=UPI002D80088D|nr:helix-turn-helix transcriptional regulator [Ramlibacter sp.]HET8745697.1 helix-turn-helix transcriptional regulator [Ramlibacter sp.]